MDFNCTKIVVEKAEDITYYEETITDGTVVFRCDYKGVAIRYDKSMFDGMTELQIQQHFFQHINNEIDETVYDIYKHAERKTSEEI